jgi:hypothetical protein
MMPKTAAMTADQEIGLEPRHEAMRFQNNQQIVPWHASYAVVVTTYPKRRNARPPVDIARVLYRQLIPHRFNLADFP